MAALLHPLRRSRTFASKYIALVILVLSLSGRAGITLITVPSVSLVRALAFIVVATRYNGKAVDVAI